MVEKGKTIRFGSYEQDNNQTNGKEGIEWIVLNIEDNKALVISKYALDCQKWSPRTWMNGTFLNNAFSAEEQAQIQNTNVSADKNPDYSTNPGNATTDKVFLLSITEAKKYFPTDKSRRCAPTAYAKAQSDSFKTASGEATCYWWLRSPGVSQRYATGVYDDGSVDYSGGRGMNIAHGCVRPALWINLDS